MTGPDYDDPEVEASWVSDARTQVAEYLSQQGLEHGPVGDWPAWHLAPMVSIWAVESLEGPGRVGWWVIYGDLPTDYVSGTGIGAPREAVAAFARRWADYTLVAGKAARLLNTPLVTVPMRSSIRWRVVLALCKSWRRRMSVGRSRKLCSAGGHPLVADSVAPPLAPKALRSRHIAERSELAPGCSLHFPRRNPSAGVGGVEFFELGLEAGEVLLDQGA